MTLRAVLARTLPVLVALAVVGALWTAVARADPYVLPPPGDVAAALADDPGLFARNAATTLAEALSGLVVAAVAAVLLAVATTESVLVRRGVVPLAVVLNVTPVVALAPALVVAFGFGPAPKVVVTALVTFFPVFAGAAAGLRSVDPAVLRVFRTVHASRWEVLLRLRFPSALPALFTALRVAFPLSLVGAVVAEFVAAGSSRGLGTLISTASSYSQLDVVFAAIACLALLGLAMLALVAAAERSVLAGRTPRH